MAGLISVVTPCVLPLVPGYLSAVAAVDVGRLEERRVVGQVVRGSLPFILGFTVVFVGLGAGAAAVGSVIDKSTQLMLSGFVLIVIGFAFLGLLPSPQTAILPGALQRARGRGSNALLGGAFAVCAAPCIGTVLASILVLASTSGGVISGSVLLAAYSLGLGTAFLACGIAFAHAMRFFRFVRNHYRLVQSGSGVVLVSLGLLLFFHRSWWLQLAVDQTLIKLGLESG